MTPKDIHAAFADLFPDFANKCERYVRIDAHSIKLLKGAFTSYIFTYHSPTSWRLETGSH